MDEDVVIQSIIHNMEIENRLLYKLHLTNEMTFKKLINLIGLLENEDNYKHLHDRTNDVAKEDKQMDIEELIGKIDNLVLNIGQNKENNNDWRHPITCELCNKRGHSRYDCLKNKPNNFFQTKSQTDEKTQNKILNIEKIIGTRVAGTIIELKTKIGKLTPQLENLINSFPNNYNAYPTLKRNEHLTSEILNHLERTTKQSNNIIYSKPKCKYEILTIRAKVKTNY